MFSGRRINKFTGAEQNKYKIAGAVILYNPAPEFVHNILSYLADIDRLYVIDNSEQSFEEHKADLSGVPKIVFTANEENLGIAKALNIAAMQAVHDGYDFRLTMDQDSEATPEMLSKMLNCLETSDADKIGIIAPRHIYTSYQGAPTQNPCEKILTTMTSGNLLRLMAYQAIGPFLDTLFIDFVDHEYCMRLAINRFSVIQANNAELHHKLGNLSEYRLPFKKFALGNHPPLRRYYITRNKFYVRDLYKKYFPSYFRPFFKYLIYEIMTILLFEDIKIGKLRMIWRGYQDYRKGRYGKYQSNTNHSLLEKLIGSLVCVIR